MLYFGGTGTPRASIYQKMLSNESVLLENWRSEFAATIISAFYIMLSLSADSECTSISNAEVVVGHP